MIEDLDSAWMTARLREDGIRLGRPLVVVEITESTNDDAKRAVRKGAPRGSAFVADAQTRGRGRMGRTWHSPAGENLYASFVIVPSLEPSTAPLVTLAAGVAVRDALAPLVPARDVTLKWPNDVLIDGRKVAGILTEAQLGSSAPSWIVVGVGINVRTATFPEELALRATSLRLAGATLLDRASLFIAVARELAWRSEALADGYVDTLIADFRARDALRGSPVTVDGVRGVALGVERDGALRVQHEDGTERLHFAGEVLLQKA